MDSRSPHDGARSPFGLLLRRFRIRADLTQEQLAEKARISPETIGALERGRRRAPQAETLGLIVDGLQLEPHDAELLARAARASRRSGGASGRDGQRDLLAVAQPVAHNIPPALNSFHDRESAIAQVAQLLGSRRIITLVGAGGVGKTRLALELVRQDAGIERFSDGVVLVELAALNDSELIAAACLAHVQPSLAADDEPLEALVAALRERRLLLILDNCEHLLMPCARLVEHITRRCEALTVLCTSREELNIDGESVVRVPPLPEPADAAGDVVTQLFIERARDIAPYALEQVTAADRDVIARICRRLDGLPLAIELAAARASDHSLRHLLEGLDDRFSVLNRGRRLANPRHRTLEGMIGWSYDLLSPLEQQLFRWLGVFAAGWPREAARFVFDPAPPTEDSAPKRIRIDEGLASLVARSLVTIELKSDGSTTYRLLESLRFYARKQLEHHAESAQAANRHAEYALAVAEQAVGIASDASRNPADAAEHIASANADVHAALDWAFQAGGSARTGMAIVRALLTTWSRLRSESGADAQLEVGEPPSRRDERLSAILLATDSGADPRAGEPSRRHEDARNRRTFRTGEHIFRRGDYADAMFLVVSGSILIEDFDVRIGSGELLGEVAFFSAAGRRTASALCETPVTVVRIDQEHLPDLLERDAGFRHRLVRVFADRILADIGRMRAAPVAVRSPRSR